ncbi:polycystin-1-like protein 2 [Saccoglossus kowalevskii]|uniref:Polycystic kidney disease protein 1-like 2-like n=1 Tax=Saccoglossus kowalevskii TaxID=10224 RepID=A0ABM0GU74_SACKO|nr:PREDICTED: polycystic kidney disease protein 1-like 2-like [Saccoglossus kowalevskii]
MDTVGRACIIQIYQDIKHVILNYYCLSDFEQVGKTECKIFRPGRILHNPCSENVRNLGGMHRIHVKLKGTQARGQAPYDGCRLMPEPSRMLRTLGIMYTQMIVARHCEELNKWRDDGRCGPGFPAPNGLPAAECDPKSLRYCCSPNKWCGITAEHCDCSGCTHYTAPVPELTISFPGDVHYLVSSLRPLSIETVCKSCNLDEVVKFTWKLQQKSIISNAFEDVLGYETESSATANRGTTLLDKFQISCYEWQDEGPSVLYPSTPSTDTNGNTNGLKYQIKISYHNSSTDSELISMSNESTSTPMIFPSGDVVNNYTVDIFIKIIDELGSSALINTSVQVMEISNEADMEAAVDQILTGEMLNIIANTEDDSLVLASVDAVVNLLQTWTSEIQDASGTVEADQPTNSKSSKKMQGVIMIELVSELLSSTLKEGNITDFVMVKSVTEGLLKTSSNILERSHSNQDIEIKEQDEMMMNKLIDAVDTCLDIALEMAPANGESVSFKTSMFEAEVSKQNSSALFGKQFNSSYGGFTLPSVARESRNTTQFISKIKFVALAINPYVLKSPAIFQNSPIVSLDIMDENGNNVYIDGDYVIDITLPDNNAEDSSLHALMYGNDTSAFELNATTADSALVLTIQVDAPVAYDIYLQAGMMPNESQYDVKWTLSDNCSNILYYRVVERDTYHLLVKSYTQNTSVYMVTLTSTFLVCRYWNTTIQEWKSDGCSPVQSEMNTITCVCNHLTSFTAGEFVVPVNKIDFSSVFNKDIADNAVVLATVLVFFAIYAILALWLRRKDKNDWNMWYTLPLAGNQTNDKYYYRVTVYTGFRLGAGTLSDIQFNISGETKESGIRHLMDKHNKMAFTTGSVHSFLLAVPCHLGPLCYIHIWLSEHSKEIFDSWFLDRIEVFDTQTEERFNFVCYKWFAVDREDEKVERVLPVSGGTQMSSFVHICWSNSRDKMTDDYLWGSMFTRPVPSNFTRVQRLSCCAVAFYLAMIANAMFYDTADAVGDTKSIYIGPLRLSLGTLYIGLISALITMPPSIIIMQLFQKSRPFRRKNCTNDGDKEMPKNDHPLPWFCVGIAWFIVFCAMFLSSFFVVLYSLQWGAEVSRQWLTSQMTSFFLSALVIDPLKALVMVIFVSSMFSWLKKPYAKVINERDHGTDVFSNNHQTEGSSIPNQPPNKQTMKQAKTIKRKDIILKTIFKDAVVYTLLILFSMEISTTYRPKSSYYTNKALANIVKSGDISPCNEMSCYYSWLNQTLTATLHSGYYYNGHKMEAGRIDLLTNVISYVIAPVVLRQLRIKPGTCTVPIKMGNIISECNAEYSVLAEEKGTFNTSWTEYNVTIDNMTMTSYEPWTHSSLYGEHMAPYFWSKMGNPYSSDGYIAVLGRNLSQSQDRINDLIQAGWIDSLTRAVFVEFAAYNPNVRVLSLVTILTEFFEHGTTTDTLRIDTLALFDLMTMDFDIFISLVCHISYFIVVMWASYYCFRQILKYGRRYFHRFWNRFQFTVTLLSSTSIGLYFVRLEITNWALAGSNKGFYGNFRYLVLIDGVFAIFVGLVSFMSVISYTRLLGLHRRTRIFQATLSIAKDSIISFSLILVIVTFAYIQLIYFYFGRTTLPFKSVRDTLLTLLSVLGGSLKANGEGILSESTKAGQLFIASYVVLESWILLMLLQSVICDACSQAQVELDTQWKDPDVMNVIMEWITSMKLYKRLHGLYKHYIYRQSGRKYRKHHNEKEHIRNETEDPSQYLIQLENRILLLENKLDEFLHDILN